MKMGKSIKCRLDATCNVLQIYGLNFGDQNILENTNLIHGFNNDMYTHLIREKFHIPDELYNTLSGNVDKKLKEIGECEREIVEIHKKLQNQYLDERTKNDLKYSLQIPMSTIGYLLNSITEERSVTYQVDDFIKSIFNNRKVVKYTIMLIIYSGSFSTIKEKLLEVFPELDSDLASTIIKFLIEIVKVHFEEGLTFISDLNKILKV